MAVELDEARHRFTVTMPEGGGELRYHPRPDGVWELYHSEVDPGLRGRGVAGELAQAAFDHARARGIKVRVTCPYVTGWLAKHPEQRDVVVA